MVQFGVVFRRIAYVEECLEDLEDVITPAMNLSPFLGRLYVPFLLKTGQDIHMGFFQKLWAYAPGSCPVGVPGGLYQSVSEQTCREV